MRGIKAKTMRRVARETKLPERSYIMGAQTGQIRLAPRSQRFAVQRMKKTSPKNSFFGFSVRGFRATEKVGTVRTFATREEALAAKAAAEGEVK